MKLKTHEIVAVALFIAGIFELYFLPKILMKKQTGMGKEETARMLLVMRISSYLTIGLGIIFLLGIIPLSGD